MNIFVSMYERFMYMCKCVYMYVCTNIDIFICQNVYMHVMHIPCLEGTFAGIFGKTGLNKN